ncbi:MAG: hypothetical protein ACFCU6_04020 [Balneolaceae bacterium]
MIHSAHDNLQFAIKWNRSKTGGLPGNVDLIGKFNEVPDQLPDLETLILDLTENLSGFYTIVEKVFNFTN